MHDKPVTIQEMCDVVRQYKEYMENKQLTLESIYETVKEYGKLCRGEKQYRRIQENPLLVQKGMLGRIADAISPTLKHEKVIFDSSKKFEVIFNYFQDQSIKDIEINGRNYFDKSFFDAHRYGVWNVLKPWMYLAAEIADEFQVDFQSVEGDDFAYMSYPNKIHSPQDIRDGAENIIAAQNTLHTIIENEVKRLNKKPKLAAEVKRLRNLC